MKIGVTGGGGFIGGHVAEVALERGHEVMIMDRSAGLTPLVKSLLDQGVVLYMGDVTDPTAMTEMAAHVDGIIHLAACLGTQETINNPFPAAATNVLGGLNFLQACRQYDIPGVYIGVGNHWMNNSYSITKTTVERFVHMYNKEHGTRVNIVRLVNAYGPRQSVAPPFGAAKVRKITPAFVCRALTGQPIEVYGDGEQISDMVHVRDGALALVKALEAAAGGNVFPVPVEVGPDPLHSRTVNEVANMVRHLVSNQFPDDIPPVDLVHLPMRPGEIAGARVSADVSTLKLVGMDAADLTPLATGLEDTVRWFQENWLPEWRTELEAVKSMETEPEGLGYPVPDPVEIQTAEDFHAYEATNSQPNHAGDYRQDITVPAPVADPDARRYHPGEVCISTCTPVNCTHRDF